MSPKEYPPTPRFFLRNFYQRPTVILLSLIMALSVFLNFYGLSQRGLYQHDEAWYILEARSLYEGGAFLLKNFSDILAGRVGTDALREAVQGVQQWGKKPGHDYLLLLGFFLFGYGDYSAFWVSAAFGVGAVFLVYLLGLLLFSEAVGLTAAGLLAVNPLYVYYTRSAMGETTGLFFFLLSVYFYIKGLLNDESNKHYLIYTGLAAGAATICNIRIGFTLPLTAILLEWVTAHNFGWSFKETCRRLIVLLIPTIGIIILSDIPFILASILFPGSSNTYLSSLAKVTRWTFASQGSSYVGLNYSAAISHFLIFSSLTFNLLLACGILTLLWQREFIHKVVFILLAGPFAIIGIFSPRPRWLVHLIPIASIIVADAIWKFSNAIKSRNWRLMAIPSTVAFLVLAIFPNIPLTTAVIEMRSPKTEAIHLVMKRYNPRHISALSLESRVYLDRASVVNFEGTDPLKAEALARKENLRSVVFYLHPSEVPKIAAHFNLVFQKEIVDPIAQLIWTLRPPVSSHRRVVVVGRLRSNPSHAQTIDSKNP